MNYNEILQVDEKIMDLLSVIKEDMNSFLYIIISIKSIL